MLAEYNEAESKSVSHDSHTLGYFNLDDRGSYNPMIDDQENINDYDTLTGGLPENFEEVQVGSEVS